AGAAVGAAALDRGADGGLRHAHASLAAVEAVAAGGAGQLDAGAAGAADEPEVALRVLGARAAVLGVVVSTGGEAGRDDAGDPGNLGEPAHPLCNHGSLQGHGVPLCLAACGLASVLGDGSGRESI